MRSTAALRLKLFALPLSRQVGSAPPHFYLHAKSVAASSLSAPDGSPLPIPLVTKATNMAASQWSKLGQSKDGSLKKKAYNTGMRLMDKIEYEEWALKAVDPALSPKPWAAIAHGAEGGKQDGADGAGKVSLLYPSSLLSPGPLLDTLKAQLAHREPHHRSAMIKCLLGAPLTFPFAIVPLVPNLPLFYVLWRAYSHFRAWKASQYLNNLISASQIDLVPSPQLDTIYKVSKPAIAAPTARDEGAELLLTLDKVPRIVHTFELTADEGHELRRAIGQADARLAQALKTDAELAEKNK